jgi:phosphotransferase system HPr (HPr) family protein
MIEREAIIRNAHGIHCRPSAKIVTAASQYAGEIAVIAPQGETDLKSLLSLVSLGLEAGTTVRIRVRGEDEARVCDELVTLFETHFDFPPISAAERRKTLDTLLDEGE